MNLDLKFKELWQTLGKVMKNSSKEDWCNLNANLEIQLKSMGLDIDNFFAEQQGPITLYICENTDRQINLPTSTGEQLKLPQLDITLCVARKGETLDQFFYNLKPNRPRLETVEGFEFIGFPFFKNPMRTGAGAIARNDNYILISSNARRLRESLRAYRHKNGLKAEKNFQQLTKSMPEKGNHYLYISPQFAENLRKTIEKNTPEKDKQGLNTLMDIFPDKIRFFGVAQVTENGIITTSNSSFRPDQIGFGQLANMTFHASLFDDSHRPKTATNKPSPTLTADHSISKNQSQENLKQVGMNILFAISDSKTYPSKARAFRGMEEKMQHYDYLVESKKFNPKLKIIVATEKLKLFSDSLCVLMSDGSTKTLRGHFSSMEDVYRAINQ